MNHAPARQQQLTIGLFGFGTVGEGIYQLLQQPSFNAVIKTVCIKDPAKKRSAPGALFTTDYNAILQDPAINLVIELISDAAEAYTIVAAALRRKKAVISANKKMIAEHLPELLALQQAQGVPLLYEAAVCAGIPIIRTLQTYYNPAFLQDLCGIVNGSTNYILTKMLEEQAAYATALRQAQALGLAEKAPALDVQGVDAANKLTLLLAHAYGIVSHPARLLHIGIDRLHAGDTKMAVEKGCRIRLLAQARQLKNGKVAAFVLPQLVAEDHPLFNVRNEYNGVEVKNSFGDAQVFYGKGAGRFPTASAVVGDLVALQQGYRYSYPQATAGTALTDDFYLRVYLSFDQWSEVNLKDFEWIESFQCSEDRQSLTGVIHFARLQQAPWLHRKSVSVVAAADAFVTDVHTRAIKKRSMALAGAQWVQNATHTLEHLPEELQAI